MRLHLGEDRTDPQAQEMVDAAHLLGLVLREIVVRRDDVHALAGQRVQVAGKGTDEGLAFTGLHLGDVAPVERGAAHELDVEVALATDTDRSFTNGSEGLRHDRVEGLAVGDPCAELVGLFAELGIAECLKILFDEVDTVRDLLQFLQLRCGTDAAQEVHESHSVSPCSRQYV